MKVKKYYFYITIILLSIIAITNAEAITNFQTFNQERGLVTNNFWDINQKNAICQTGQDMILEIIPGSCSPSVVRSDLLESQNVPVFCQVTGIKINPSVDLGKIASVSFAGSGGLPEGVAGISFYPYRAAVTQTNNLFTSGGVANIGNSLGYVVVVLKQTPVEKDMPGAIMLNLTAKISYDVKKVYGSGKVEYFLQQNTDEEWNENYKEYGIFKGQQYLRLEELSIDGTQAKVSIYKDKDTIINSINLRLGEQSSLLNIPGFYCGAGIRMKLTGSEAPRKKVQLQVDQDTIWLHEGQKFLNEQCVVRSIEITNRTRNNGLEKGIVRISCPKGSYELEISELDQSLGTQNIAWDKVLAGISSDPTKKQIIESFEKAKEEAYLVADLYTSEKRSNNENYKPGQFYGLSDLQELAITAQNLGQYKTELEIQEKIISKYPGTIEELESQKRIGELKNFSYIKANAITTVDFSIHTITIKNYKNPAVSEASVEFDRPAEPRIIGDYIYTTDKNQTAGEAAETWVRIREIKKDSIILQARITETIKDANGKETKNVRSADYTMTEGQTLATINGLNLPGLIGGINGNNVQLKKINLKVEAKVEVVPEILQTGSSSNFTFKVAIEKRGIKISTEKTEEMIRNINESIEKFTKITEKLGQAVETGKAACLAGSSALFIKNFIANAGGAAGSRAEVMNGPDGWYQKCDRLVKSSPSQYNNLNDCLLKNNANIQEDVTKWTEAEKAVNTQFDNVYNKENITGSQQEFIKVFANDVCGGKLKDKQITIEEKTKIICGQGGVFENKEAVIAAYNQGDFTIADAKKVMTASQTYGGANTISQNTDTLGAQKINGFFSNMQRRPGLTTANYAGALGTASGKVFSAYSPDTRIANVEVIEVKAGDKLGGTVDVKEGRYTLISVAPGTRFADPASTTKLAGKVLVVPVTTDASGNVQLNESDPTKNIIIDSNGKNVDTFTRDEYGQVLGQNKISSFKSITESQASCSNYYQNPTVKYFTSGQYSGLPAVVPIDTAKGWYVATKDSELAPYTEAGQLRTFWICNVGKDGLEQFDYDTDDKHTCFQVNLDKGTPVDQSYCFNEAETRQIISRAQQAIGQAGKYDQGRTKTNILGTNYNIEKVASSAPGTQCQDFMSPSDCNIMFNLCDPVICPASRCDLGGTYRVDDVIQSGIAGSIALCLPNAKEGIYVPICLSGIYAGLDAYTSVQKAHRDCLQNSLATGQYTGLCDEIRSVYMCEFFWRQATPIIKAGIPKLIEGLTSSNTARAGGEYSNFQKAYTTADQSVNYFTQVYGQQAFSAFKIRSTADIGTQVCQQFASANYPDSASIIDSLIKPESPVQFYAQFDEIPYSEATVPPTSQYNVFYHIYAGKEKGTYFTVYLKNPPQNGLYAGQETILINQGFIPAGEYDSQKIEKTLPSGYRELCVNINGKDECGFQKVTTDYGINTLGDKYAQEQATNQAVTKEEECINGDSSIYSLANSNLEAGLDNALNPAIYQQGIIRMCSAQNPGQNAGDNTGLETVRWKDVGYCTDQKIRCWLDTTSVKEVIKNKQIQNQTIEQVSQQLGEPSQGQAEQRISAALGIINGVTFAAIQPAQLYPSIIDPMTEIEQDAFPSFTKVRATDTKFQAFIKIVNGLYAGQTINNINTISTNVANATAQIKRDCEITGYTIPPVNPLTTGKTLPFLINFAGQCNDWNTTTVELIKIGDPNYANQDFTQQTYQHQIDLQKEKGVFSQNIALTEKGKYFLKISLTYKDSQGRTFTEISYNGKGKQQFEVIDGGASGATNQSPGAPGTLGNP
ncbi:MAG: hypothetical protein AABW73_04270 [Nanoarchaeota archaeon]